VKKPSLLDLTEPCIAPFGTGRTELANPAGLVVLSGPTSDHPRIARTREDEPKQSVDLWFRRFAGAVNENVLRRAPERCRPRAPGRRRPHREVVQAMPRLTQKQAKRPQLVQGSERDARQCIKPARPGSKTTCGSNPFKQGRRQVTLRERRHDRHDDLAGIFRSLAKFDRCRDGCTR
jgi:hypothetical protein